MQFAGRLRIRASRPFSIPYLTFTASVEGGVQTFCSNLSGSELAPCNNLQARHFSPSARGSANHWEHRPLRLIQPALAPVTGHVHGQFEPAPDTQFVESAAQMVLDDLLRGAYELANLAVGC